MMIMSSRADASTISSSSRTASHTRLIRPQVGRAAGVANVAEVIAVDRAGSEAL